MIGIDIILWIFVAGALAKPLSEIVTLGKSISSIYGFLVRKQKKSAVERKFIDISPLASLVQMKLYTRVLPIAIAVLIVVGLLVYVTGKFSIVNFGINEFIDMIVVFSIILSIRVIDKMRFLRKFVISEDEQAILKEFRRCYLAYIREKREGLGILTYVDSEILGCLTKKQSKTFKEIKKCIEQKDAELSLTEKQTTEALNFLRSIGYVKKRRKGYYLKELPLSSGNLNEEEY